MKLITSPKGIARWPKLTVPDTAMPGKVTYNVALVIEDEEAAQAFASTLRDNYDKEWFPEFAKREGLKPMQLKSFKHVMPWKQNTRGVGEGTDRVYEEIPGLVFPFKMNAEGISKKTGRAWTNRPVIYDAMGALMHPTGSNGKMDPSLEPTVDVGGGSIIRVAFEPNVYAGFGGGLSLRLSAVQVIELRSAGRGLTFEDTGFEPEESGFSRSEQMTPSGSEDTDNVPF